MQYTLRNIPKALDGALRRRAKRERKTLNQVALEAMAEGVGLGSAEEPIRRSVRDLIGTMKREPAMDRALHEQRRVDPELWR
jgi:hypothetical protein